MGVPAVSSLTHQQPTNSSIAMSDPFPEIKSTHSLVAKYVTQPIWEKLSRAVTKTSGFSLSQAIACAVQFDNQHCGIYAGDWDSYKVFADVFDPIIQEYHGISPDSVHTSDMDVGKIKGNIDPTAPVHSTRIRGGRSINGSSNSDTGGVNWCGRINVSLDLSNIHVTCVNSIRRDSMVILDQGVKHISKNLIGVPVSSINATVLVIKLCSTSNGLGQGEPACLGHSSAQLLPDRLGHILCYK